MQFIYSYSGNKRNEVKYIEPLITKNFIIEPFCGTSAISFEIYKKRPETNFILGDADENLMKVYELLKNESYQKIELEINNIINRVSNKEEYQVIYDEYKNNFCVYKHIYLHKYCTMGRLGFYPIKNKRGTKDITIFKLTKIQLEFIDFIKSPRTIIKCCDWENIYNEYSNNKEVCFIFDPPYVLSDNSFYKKNKQNIYEYFYNNPINNKECEIIFTLEKNWIIELLFKNNKYIEYPKTYQITKKKTTHIVITNQVQPQVNLLN